MKKIILFKSRLSALWSTAGTGFCVGWGQRGKESSNIAHTHTLTGKLNSNRNSKVHFCRDKIPFPWVHWLGDGACGAEMVVEWLVGVLPIPLIWTSAAPPPTHFSLSIPAVHTTDGLKMQCLLKNLQRSICHTLISGVHMPKLPPPPGHTSSACGSDATTTNTGNKVATVKSAEGGGAIVLVLDIRDGRDAGDVVHLFLGSHMCGITSGWGDSPSRSAVLGIHGYVIPFVGLF